MLNMLILLGSLTFSPADSLRTETINGKVFIIHQVDAKETLFSISRRYGVAMANIIEFNADADGGIETGQLLKIPYTAKKRPSAGSDTHEVGARETLYSISRMYSVSVDDLKAWNNLTSNELNLGQHLIVRKPATPAVLDKAPPVAITHVVKEKETLYGISRQYGVKVQDLRTWNNLDAAAGLKPGQTIIVSEPATASTATDKTTDKVVDKVADKTGEKVTPVNNGVITISERVLGSDEVRESGNAQVLEGSEGNRKYQGLHRTAKTGTIVKVRNTLTNQEVFVRVTGPLDSAESADTIIKMSKSAYDKIGAGPATAVEVIYYK